MGAREAGHSALGCASWEAFGTGVVMRLSRSDAGALERARESVERELVAIDRACSRFRSDSELVRLNAHSGRAIHVSALLMEALELALHAAELTGGDVDPTVGRALELAGYDRDWRLLESRAPRAPDDEIEPRPTDTASSAPSSQGLHAPRATGAITLRARSGWRAVALDPRDGTVGVPRGICLDLGATAKAWAADRAARAAASAAGCGALVSIGGDISTCGDAPPQGWLVHVTDDHRSEATVPGQTIAISCGGLATSSTDVRRWRQHGRTMHHIIDPRTGAPARGIWRTASVAAASCAEANIASTAALVRGASAYVWLAELGLPARLVERDGTVHHLGDWPAERVRERRS